ncbi:unnamed protein product [Owenia fusiformis]|uniref:Uncharacterized protein n=1 Tax=Owenia fusiformis TaxID=6347 RepID=A0A8S4PRE4_OWEFU|nr:unnamed protein product [Owenia fusiformis]
MQYSSLFLIFFVDELTQNACLNQGKKLKVCYEHDIILRNHKDEQRRAKLYRDPKAQIKCGAFYMVDSSADKCIKRESSSNCEVETLTAYAECEVVLFTTIINPLLELMD